MGIYTSVDGVSKNLAKVSSGENNIEKQLSQLFARVGGISKPLMLIDPSNGEFKIVLKMTKILKSEYDREASSWGAYSIIDPTEASKMLSVVFDDKNQAIFLDLRFNTGDPLFSIYFNLLLVGMNGQEVPYDQIPMVYPVEIYGNAYSSQSPYGSPYFTKKCNWDILVSDVSEEKKPEYSSSLCQNPFGSTFSFAPLDLSKESTPIRVTIGQVPSDYTGDSYTPTFPLDNAEYSDHRYAAFEFEQFLYNNRIGPISFESSADLSVLVRSGWATKRIKKFQLFPKYTIYGEGAAYTIQSTTSFVASGSSPYTTLSKYNTNTLTLVGNASNRWGIVGLSVQVIYEDDTTFDIAEVSDENRFVMLYYNMGNEQYPRQMYVSSPNMIPQPCAGTKLSSGYGYYPYDGLNQNGRYVTFNSKWTASEREIMDPKVFTYERDGVIYKTLMNAIARYHSSKPGYVSLYKVVYLGIPYDAEVVI